MFALHNYNHHYIYLYCAQNTTQIAAKEKNLEKNNLSKLEECSKADSDGVIEAQNHYHAVSAGLSSNKDGEDKTLADQLMGK